MKHAVRQFAQWMTAVAVVAPIASTGLVPDMARAQDAGAPAATAPSSDASRIMPSETPAAAPGEGPRENRDNRDPATRPSFWRDGMSRGERGERGQWGGGERPGGDRPGGGSRFNVPSPSEDEWNDIVAFMTTNSPQRLGLYRDAEAKYLTENPRVLDMVRRRLAVRYRELNSLRERSADMYEFGLKQFQLEDQVLGTMIEMRAKGETAELLQQMQVQLQEFTQNTLNERAQRVKRLREILEREEKSLAADQVRMDALIEQQRDRFERDMKKLVEWKEENEDHAPKEKR